MALINSKWSNFNAIIWNNTDYKIITRAKIKRKKERNNSKLRNFVLVVAWNIIGKTRTSLIKILYY